MGVRREGRSVLRPQAPLPRATKCPWEISLQYPGAGRRGEHKRCQPPGDPSWCPGIFLPILRTGVPTDVPGEEGGV